MNFYGNPYLLLGVWYLLMVKPDSFKSILFAFFALGLAVFVVLQQNAHAITGFDPTPTSSTWSQGSSGTTYTAGNIYNATVGVSEQTYRWTALVGNVTGSVVLRDASSNTLISWVVTDVQNASVMYATTDSSTLDPTDLAFCNSTFLKLADEAYGYDWNVTDSILNTFTQVDNFQSPSMDDPVVSNTTTLNTHWKNFLLRIDTDWPTGTYSSGQADFVWAVEVVNDMPSFASHLVDYEILIPENEEAGQKRPVARD